MKSTSHRFQMSSMAKRMDTCVHTHTHSLYTKTIKISNQFISLLSFLYYIYRRFYLNIKLHIHFYRKYRRKITRFTVSLSFYLAFFLAFLAHFIFEYFLELYIKTYILFVFSLIFHINNFYMSSILFHVCCFECCFFSLLDSLIFYCLLIIFYSVLDTFALMGSNAFGIFNLVYYFSLYFTGSHDCI